MKYEHTVVGDYLLVQLIGSLDSAGAADVEKQFNVLTGYNVLKVVVDMSQVDFISSVGIGLLLNHARTFQKKGGQMKFFGLQGKVRKILETTGILKMLSISDTKDACIASFK